MTNISYAYSVTHISHTYSADKYQWQIPVTNIRYAYSADAAPIPLLKSSLSPPPTDPHLRQSRCISRVEKTCWSLSLVSYCHVMIRLVTFMDIMFHNRKIWFVQKAFHIKCSVRNIWLAAINTGQRKMVNYCKGWLAIATLKPTFTFLGRGFAK